MRPKIAPGGIWAAKRWLLSRHRAASDRIAGRFGYRHESECTGWDE